MSYLLPATITGTIPKRIMGDRDTTYFYAIYPDKTGKVYFNANSIPLAWNTPQVRDSAKVQLSVKVQLAVEVRNGISLLVAQDTTNTPVASAIVESLNKNYPDPSLLVTGSFIPSEYGVAAIETMNARFASQRQLLDLSLKMGHNPLTVLHAMNLEIGTPEYQFVTAGLLTADGKLLTSSNNVVDVQSTVVSALHSNNPSNQDSDGDAMKELKERYKTISAYAQKHQNFNGKTWKAVLNHAKQV